MDTKQILKQNFKSIICVNPKLDIYLTFLSPHELIDNENTYIKCIPVRTINKPTIEKLKTSLLSFVEDNDNSSNVNSFSIGNTDCWFDKQTRLFLRNKFSLLSANDKELNTLWVNNTLYKVDVPYMLEFLDNLELYAMKVLDCTNTHKSNINKLNTFDDICKYDIFSNYPNKLEFDTTKIYNYNDITKTS